MSRIGQTPVNIPDGVTIEIVNTLVSAKGKLGELSIQLSNDVTITKVDNTVVVKPVGDTLQARKMWGTARAVINNLVVGVSEGFSKKLTIIGTGYRATLQGKKLQLQLGFSHDVFFEIPDGITIKCPDQTHLEVCGVDKQQVGAVAAKIRSYRPPEPYKGKGVRYDDEYILRKEGKKK